MFQCCVKVRFRLCIEVPLNISGNRKMSTIDSLFISKARKARQEKKKFLSVMDSMKADINLNKSQKEARANYYIKKEWVKTNTNISNIILYVLGSGAIGAPKSLYLATDNKGYLFNCGDSCQRLTSQLKLKLTKLQDIFVTQSVWENIGGITGLMLTLQEAGIPELDVHGPPGVDSLLTATANFTQIKKLKPLVHNLTEEGTYEDGLMKIKYFPIYAPEADNKYTEKYFLKLPKKKLAEAESNGEEGITTIENVCSSEQDYYEYLENPSKADNEESSEEEILEEEMIQSKRNYTHFKEKRSICYVCQSPKILGALDLEACVERNVPPGPLFGKLKNKQDITLSDGTVVKWTDVTHPDTPGTTFVIIDCPSVNYLDSLINNKGINEAQAATEPENKIKLVVHFSPPSVMNHPRYKEWVKGFQDETQHLRLNEDNSCIGTPATYKLQTKLNMIHPTIFPPLAKGVIPIRKKNEEANSPNLLYVEESSSDISEQEDKNKIIIGTTMLTINLKKFNIFRDPNYFLCPEEFIEEAFAERGAQEAVEELKVQAKEIESVINSTTDGDYPKIVFLGTGSSSPKNIRNTSGILVFTSPDACLLLDCGEGTYGQIVRLFGRDKVDDIMLKLRAVYVSHLHADHHLGFIGLIKGRRRAIDNFLEKHRDLFKDENLTKSEKIDRVNIRPLYLVAPPTISSYLKTYDSDVEHILEDFNLISNGVLKILYYLDKPEYIRIKKRMKVRVVPVPDIIKFFLSDCNLKEFKTCHVRHCFNSYGATLVTSNGCRITYSGDTMPCGALVEIGLGSDLLIHEATMDNDRAVDAAKKLHSTIGQAVDVGQQMKAKHIVLTHFSQRYAYIPRFTETLPDNVGIAFDNMIVSMKQLPLLPKFLPAMRLFFAEQLRLLEGRSTKEQLNMKKKQEYLEAKKKGLNQQLKEKVKQ